MNDTALHADYLGYIGSETVRDVYRYLVHYAERLENFRCFPLNKGVIRTFRYAQGDDEPFSFIVNKWSVLFYFRNPSQGHRARDAAYLSRRFREVRVNRLGEITIRVSDLGSACLLMDLVFGDAQAEQPERRAA